MRDEQIMNTEEEVLYISHQSNIPASNFVVYSIFLNVEVILAILAT